tara:strand:+ start:302 stop:502 length:201 start_codon:yes stop_codon:yes gene_type:complete
MFLRAVTHSQHWKMLRANASGRMRQGECPGQMRQAEAVAGTSKPYIIVRTNEMQTQTNSNGTLNPG